MKTKKHNKLKILLFDIETSPTLGYTWGVYEQNVIETEKDWYMLSFAAKWLGEKEVMVYGLCDFKGYRKDKSDDYELVQKLHELLEEADVIVAHNGDRFDLRKARTRFVIHRLPPPHPGKTVDTLKIARRVFKFDSNKLDDLGNYLNVGRKLPNTGKHLWLGCMRGDKKAWEEMKRYNKQDVVLLERVYEVLRGWDTKHANLAYMTREGYSCPICQSKNLVKNGKRYSYTLSKEFQRYQCRDCGAWSKDNGEPLRTRPMRM